VITKIILTNIRVLAIDQAPKEKDGQNSVVGKTVTLELKPEQTATLAAARQAGTLSLALRSIADVNQVEIADDSSRQRGSVNVVRYGITNPTTIQK
jgi:pilus assembly protein CpaB